ncbi:MAG: hypothetical protein H8E15_17805 [Planctomycetes bacterium]|nr:hypothetical protein [Planctomycetota bacterium]
MNLLLPLCSLLLAAFQTPCPDCEQNPTENAQQGCEQTTDCEHTADCESECGSMATPASAPVPVLTAQAHCPVDGTELKNRDNFVDYEAQRVFLCADKKCIDKFKAFPDKWLGSLMQMGEAPMNTQTVCPITGNPVNKDSLTVWVGNKSVRVCCNGCVAQVTANPSAFLDKLEGRKPQEKCAVMGGAIIPQNAFGVQGTVVNQCCPGCEGQWRKDPNKFFTKLASAKVVLQPVLDRCAVHPDKAAVRTQFVTLGSRRFYFSDAKSRGEFLKNPKVYLKAMPDVAKGKLPTAPLFSQLASAKTATANSATPAKAGCGKMSGGCGKMKGGCSSGASACTDC